MAYTKTVWKDYPDTTTKMTAQKLNNIEDGIEDLEDDLNNNIDELNNKLNWKLLGNIANVGENYALTIPSDAEEILVECFPSDYYDGTIALIKKPEVISVAPYAKGYDSGFYEGPTDMMRILIYASNDKVWIQLIKRSGSSITSILSCKVYYR